MPFESWQPMPPSPDDHIRVRQKIVNAARYPFERAGEYVMYIRKTRERERERRTGPWCDSLYIHAHITRDWRLPILRRASSSCIRASDAFKGGADDFIFPYVILRLRTCTICIRIGGELDRRNLIGSIRDLIVLRLIDLRECWIVRGYETLRYRDCKMTGECVNYNCVKMWNKRSEV